MRRLLIAALACVCAAAPALITSGAAHAAGTDCTDTVQITALTVDKQSVSPGQSLTATTTIQNCTDQPQQVTGYWRAQSVMPPDVPYSFCTGNDPFPISTQIAASGTYTASFRWDISNPQCAAAAIRVNVVLYSPSVTRSVDVPVNGAAPSSCVATYRNLSEWPGGFVAQVTVTNPGGSPTGRWSVTFAYPGDQQITSSWGATVQQTGGSVTATNAAWDGTIAAGGSVTFGFNGTWRSSDVPPSTVTCQAA